MTVVSIRCADPIVPSITGPACRPMPMRSGCPPRPALNRRRRVGHPDRSRHRPVGGVHEQRHHRVADELVDEPAVGVHGCVHSPRGTQLRSWKFSAARHPLGDRGEVAEVAEQDGHVGGHGVAQLHLHHAVASQTLEERPRHEPAERGGHLPLLFVQPGVLDGDGGLPDDGAGDGDAGGGEDVVPQRVLQVEHPHQLAGPVQRRAQHRQTRVLADVRVAFEPAVAGGVGERSGRRRFGPRSRALAPATPPSARRPVPARSDRLPVRRRRLGHPQLDRAVVGCLGGGPYGEVPIAPEEHWPGSRRRSRPRVGAPWRRRRRPPASRETAAAVSIRVSTSIDESASMAAAGSCPRSRSRAVAPYRCHTANARPSR